MKLQDRVLSHLLDSPATATSDRIKNVTMLLVLNVAWALVVVQLLGFLWPEMFATFSTKEMIVQFFFTPEPPFRWEFFMACIAAPLWEELAFRVAPYQISKWFTDKFGGRDLTLWIILLSTIMFGWGHGQGTISLLFQGFGGLFLTYAYIKNGYSYWSSVGLHFMWNFGCLLLGQ